MRRIPRRRRQLLAGLADQLEVGTRPRATPADLCHLFGQCEPERRGQPKTLVTMTGLVMSADGWDAYQRSEDELGQPAPVVAAPALERSSHPVSAVGQGFGELGDDVLHRFTEVELAAGLVDLQGLESLQLGGHQ